MNRIVTLSESEGRARSIFLNAPAKINKPHVRELQASAACGAARATTTTRQPATLAEAIAAEIRAGNGEHAASAAAKKFPELAKAWLAGMKCGSPELSQ